MAIAEIFTEMSWIPALLLTIGAIFILIEVFVPGFGFWGVFGTLSLIVGVVVRIVNGLNVEQSIMLILIIFIFLIICGILLVYSAQFGFLSHTGLFENKSTIAKDYNKVDRSLRRLVGRSGKTVSALTLGGKAKIAGKIYDVVSINSYVEPNKHIRVVEIKDNQIMVRRWFE